jgi:hypothetical protein
MGRFRDSPQIAWIAARLNQAAKKQGKRFTQARPATGRSKAAAPQEDSQHCRPHPLAGGGGVGACHFPGSLKKRSGRERRGRVWSLSPADGKKKSIWSRKAGEERAPTRSFPASSRSNPLLRARLRRLIARPAAEHGARGDWPPQGAPSSAASTASTLSVQYPCAQNAPTR